MKNKRLLYVAVGIGIYYVWVHYFAGSFGFHQAVPPTKGKSGTGGSGGAGGGGGGSGKGAGMMGGYGGA